MVTIYNTTLSATFQRHFSDGLGGVLILFPPADKRQSPADLYMAFAGQYTANSTAHTQITITLLILNVFNSLGDLPLPGR